MNIETFKFWKRSNRQGDQENRVITLPRNRQSEFPTNKINTALYSPLSFIPLFLIGQFSKLANLYFLIIGLLEQIPGVSPVGRFITLVPLCMILFVSMVKEIIEDIKRRSSDTTVNSLKCQVFTKQWRRTSWGDIHVGDIVRVSTDQTFPADVVLLTTSEPSRTCYVQTSSLDGETNYKIRYPIPIAIDCENVVLRGSQLKNTHWVIGVVVYTGSETKIMLNSTRNVIKRSTVDYATNWLVLCLMGILLCLTAICAVFYESFLREVGSKHTYLGGFDHSQFTFHYSFITFFILFHNIIPISLVVTLEIVKMIQSYVISHDPQLYSKTSETNAIVKTSAIIEELGQINYIFTDKTGTLTCNEMILREISIGSQKHQLTGQLPVDFSYVFKNVDKTTFDLFVMNLLLCNTVVPEEGQDSRISFQSSSPDETAILSALYDNNYKLLKRNGNEITIDFNGVVENWTVLAHIDFTSERKRMSVIVQSPRDEIYLFMKGADVVIFERLGSHEGEMYEGTFRNLEIFALNGLRTLCLAYKRISHDECKVILSDFQQAITNIAERDVEIEKVADRIERDLQILGATGIEDRLQDRVPETIQALRKANIKIWMLTGDKLETAINIGYSCNLIDHEIDLKVISCNDIDSCRQLLESILLEKGIPSTEFGKIRQNPARHANFSIVITGKELAFALDPACVDIFIDVVIHSKSVICCRVSPLQKQNVLLMIKQQVNDTITLAIGDGANDCSMIKAANVGVGIIGKEGMQAANTADFAIGEFSHLTRLLFVHGAASYRLIVYISVFTKILFSIYCHFSTTSLTYFLVKWSSVVYIWLCSMYFTPHCPLFVLDCWINRAHVRRILMYLTCTKA
ncbi:Phospholipid-transporting ATPase IA [Thelohanellus kitauei]|uniref:Phospholipid-transporting ATPase n=1 Tax=Thelohanellus kitauei TaxID=669202 RepID=A0A0C2MVW3_THEKT|nr:Phospholipid-transporting ATPase IA [Thelohanellus kitauei]